MTRSSNIIPAATSQYTRHLARCELQRSLSLGDNCHKEVEINQIGTRRRAHTPNDTLIQVRERAIWTYRIGST